jgi:hypothetical protein
VVGSDLKAGSMKDSLSVGMLSSVGGLCGVEDESCGGGART